MNGKERFSPLFGLMLASMLWLILMLLTSCASPRQTIPPMPMLEPRPLPQWDGKTYRDLVGYSLRLKEAAAASEADKRAAKAVLGVK